MVLGLTVIHVFHMAHGKSEDTALEAAGNLFRGAVINALGENLADAYMYHFTSKDMWDALEAKFGVSDVGSELYVMKLYNDYKMIHDCPVVEQAHEIQSLAKELENFACVLPKKICGRWYYCQSPSLEELRYNSQTKEARVHCGGSHWNS